MKFNGRETTIPRMPIGFIDRSYGNDVCAHFEKEYGKYTIEIWIENDNPDTRECLKQYLIGIRKEDECEFEEFVEFDKNDFSENALNEVSRQFQNEVFRLMKKYQN
jgi:hypothetical protein